MKGMFLVTVYSPPYHKVQSIVAGFCFQLFPCLLVGLVLKKKCRVLFCMIIILLLIKE